jgi:periplasmic protein CpxP/Spy
MKLKTSLAIAVFATTFSVCSYAQDAPPPAQGGRPPREGRGPGWEKRTPEERAAKATEMMKKRLNLSEAQATKVAQLNLERAKKQEDIREVMQESPAVKQAKEDRKAMVSKYDADLKAVLTPEQYAQFSKERDDRKDMMKDRREERRGRDRKGND